MGIVAMIEMILSCGHVSPCRSVMRP